MRLATCKFNHFQVAIEKYIDSHTKRRLHSAIDNLDSKEVTLLQQVS